MSATTQPDPRIGQRIERFELEELLGVGGFGKVYRARHTVLDRRVALKLLHAGHTPTEEQLDRFLREARTAASVGSRHIIEVYDGGVTREGEAFIAFALLEGEDLEQLLDRRGPPPVPEALELMQQLLAGLGAAHTVGVLHRDIKPSNLFLRTLPGERRELVILDFGIAKALQSELPKLTADGSMLGTPAYMAPEQLFAPTDVDARADLYAAGVVLYEMLSGRLPHEAANLATLIAKVSTEPPVPLGAVAPGLSPRLIALVERATARERAHRFHSAAEMAQELLWAQQSTPSGHADPARAVAPSLGMSPTLPSIPPSSIPPSPGPPSPAHTGDSRSWAPPSPFAASPPADQAHPGPRAHGHAPDPSPSSAAPRSPSAAPTTRPRSAAIVLSGVVALAALVIVAVAAFLVGRSGGGKADNPASALAPPVGSDGSGAAETTPAVITPSGDKPSPPVEVAMQALDELRAAPAASEPTDEGADEAIERPEDEGWVGRVRLLDVHAIGPDQPGADLGALFGARLASMARCHHEAGTIEVMATYSRGRVLSATVIPDLEHVSVDEGWEVSPCFRGALRPVQLPGPNGTGRFDGIIQLSLEYR